MVCSGLPSQSFNKLALSRHQMSAKGRKHLRPLCIQMMKGSLFCLSLRASIAHTWCISVDHWLAACSQSLPRYAPLAETAKDVPHTPSSAGSRGPAWSPPKRGTNTSRCTKEVKASPALRILKGRSPRDPSSAPSCVTQLRPSYVWMHTHAHAFSNARGSVCNMSHII